MELRIEMGDFNNSNVVASYAHFSIGDEAELYCLSVDGYSTSQSGKTTAYAILILLV